MTINYEMLTGITSCAFLGALCCAILERRKRKTAEKALDDTRHVLEETIGEFADLAAAHEPARTPDDRLPDRETRPRSERVKHLLRLQDISEQARQAL